MLGGVFEPSASGSHHPKPLSGQWMKNKMDSKDRHRALDGASLGRTKWIKTRTGLGRARLRMLVGPSLTLGVFSASFSEASGALGLGSQISLQSEQNVSSSSPRRFQLTKLNLCQRFPDSS